MNGVRQMLTRLIVAASLCVSTVAFAQQGGTPAERRACSANVMRYCAKYISGGDLSVLGCLQENRPKLKPACQKVLSDHGV